MIDPQYYVPLSVRLSAMHDPDLMHLSALCQDALCSVTSMHFDMEKKIFSLNINRFCWELLPHKHSVQHHFRVQTALVFHNVATVFKRNCHQAGPMRHLNLLMLDTHNTDHQNRLRMIFSGDMAIEIVGHNDTPLSLRAHDVGHPWPTHTKPQHWHEHIDQLKSLAQDL